MNTRYSDSLKDDGALVAIEDINLVIEAFPRQKHYDVNAAGDFNDVFSIIITALYLLLLGGLTVFACYINSKLPNK